MYISSLVTQGERTPAFTGNAEYHVTGVNYDQGPGRITSVGEKSLKSRGEQLAIDFGSSFLNDTYDPSNIFVRTINDQQSIIGAYAYLLGVFPDTVNGITLEPDIEAITSVPVTNYDVNSVRGNVDLGDPKKPTSQAKILPGNPDALFLTQVGELYPGLTSKIDQQLFQAKEEYEKAHGTKFYEDFAKLINQDIENVNFYTIYRYADDIIATRANGKRSAVNLSKETFDDLSIYYAHYFGNGLFGDPGITRVFATSYLSSVAHELTLKVDDDKSSKYQNQAVHDLKHSLYLSNHLTLLAAIKLFDEVSDYHLDFNDELKFELFKKDGKYFVKSLLNDEPLSLEGTNDKNGEAEFSKWRDYICSKLYYGNTASARDGKEDPDQNLKLSGSCEDFIAKSFYFNDNVYMKHVSKPDTTSSSSGASGTSGTSGTVAAGSPLGGAPSSSLTGGLDEGVRSQSIDINAGKTSQVVEYGFYKPIKLTQTQWKKFEIPMKHGFTFNNLSKKPISLNQYRKIKIEKTTKIPINLAERHSFNFGHDLLKTREIIFNNVDLIKIPQMSEKNIYLADKHHFNWGENPSLTTMKLNFNYHVKLKIPTTTVKEYKIPEKHSFNYNSNSLDVRKVNFDHIKSVKIKQAESYDVSLLDFRFESLQPYTPPTPKPAANTTTSAASSPSSSSISLGGGSSSNTSTSAPAASSNTSTPAASTSASTTETAKPKDEGSSSTPATNTTTAPSSDNGTSTDDDFTYEPPKQYPAYSPPKRFQTYNHRDYPHYTPRSHGSTRVVGTPYRHAR